LWTRYIQDPALKEFGNARNEGNELNKAGEESIGFSCLRMGFGGI